MHQMPRTPLVSSALGLAFRCALGAALLAVLVALPVPLARGADQRAGDGKGGRAEKVGKLPKVEFNIATRQVRVECESLAVNAPLEFFCCLAGTAEQVFDTLSGGQQARLQILLLELSGATLLLLDEPTDNLDLQSAQALEEGLAAFEGTVVAVTHDRWFARSFDRFLVFGADGRVYEADEPVWDEARVARKR